MLCLLNKQLSLVQYSLHRRAPVNNTYISKNLHPLTSTDHRACPSVRPFVCLSVCPLVCLFPSDYLPFLMYFSKSSVLTPKACQMTSEYNTAADSDNKWNYRFDIIFQGCTKIIHMNLNFLCSFWVNMDLGINLYTRTSQLLKRD